AVVGPGMGADESSAAFLRALLLTEPAVPTPVVLDADALNILANIYGWPSMLAVPTVLTPHPGEMGRLLGRPAHEVQVDRKGAALASAEQWGQVVVLKGAHTVIAAPDGRVGLSPFANPALATAGSGDVLAGVIGGLLAQGMERYEAAVAGVYLHGAAAERWSAANGSGGMLASDLLALLPRVTEDTRTR
ncbi:MAG: NAD(P)H-hydrate dehydratase, partial [Chloroflexi bacterium]|nr:NAD(P)H-hydrate dehydratase [Chloroflexota bacterium]